MFYQIKKDFINKEFHNCLSIYENKLSLAVNIIKNQADELYPDIDWANIVSPNLEIKLNETLKSLKLDIKTIRDFKSIDEANEFINNELFNNIEKSYSELKNFILEDFKTSLTDLEYSFTFDSDNLSDEYEQIEDDLSILESQCEQHLQVAFFEYIIKFFIDLVDCFHQNWNYLKTVKII